MNKPTYKHTLAACYIGYITQAIINNYIPLLFVTFNGSYGISTVKISLLITVNFGFQMLVDILSSYIIRGIGMRRTALLAHVCAALGLICLAFLPEVMPDPFVGLVISIMIYAAGSGLIEVIVSPLAESCPTTRKEAHMALLHSFYCWGHLAVVLLSTLFFHLFGIENWRALALIWAAVPLFNLVMFARVPIFDLPGEDSKTPYRALFKSGVFWIFLVIMLCAGAAEQAMSQWASSFAEAGLGVSKELGDLLGPCAFAFFMGAARVSYGFFDKKIKLSTFIMGSSAVCILTYLVASLSPLPIVSLVGCALCGLSVGIMWPGTFSLAAGRLPHGGAALYSLMALAGDIGCLSGPGLVGLVTENSGDMHTGLLCAIVFPALLIVCTAAAVKRHEAGFRR